MLFYVVKKSMVPKIFKSFPEILFNKKLSDSAKNLRNSPSPSYPQFLKMWAKSKNTREFWEWYLEWNIWQFCSKKLTKNVSMILGKCANIFAYCTGLQGWAIYTNPLWFGSNRNGKWQIAKLNELDDATSSKCLMELIRQCWTLCWPQI